MSRFSLPCMMDGDVASYGAAPFSFAKEFARKGLIPETLKGVQFSPPNSKVQL